MRYLMADLYRAFNPAVEIRSAAWLVDASKYKGDMTKEELIAQGSMTRYKLESRLPDLQYRILKLFFTEPSCMDSALIDIRIISPVIIALSGIRGKNNNQFVELCCLSEFWQADLFKTDKFGPLTKYATNVSYEMLRRRRCRIRDVLEKLRIESVATAECLLYGDYEAMVLVS